MAHDDTTIMEQSTSPAPDELEEIELEPTGSYPLIDATDPSQSIRMALAKDSMPSLSSETRELLRRRLIAAALFLAAMYGFFFIIGLIEPNSPYGRIRGYHAVRCLVCCGMIALLYSAVSLSYRQLRMLEYGFFGFLVIVIVLTQYLAGSALIAAGDLVHLVGMEKNGLLNFLIVIILYGVLIPNDPKTTASVAFTMALGPLFVLLVLTAKAERGSQLMNELKMSHLAIGNAIYLALSVALASYAAYVLNHLRRDLHEAKKLGQYQLKEKIGEGGMGEVYLAEHQLLKRPCALKLIKPDAGADPIALGRFEREVRAVSMLSHPNTIQIFDYGHSADGTFYYVMEYLPGMNVGDVVRRTGPMEPSRVIYLARQVCGSLQEAHRFGLVHRDLKPANILVSILGGKCDVAKVLDFGLVKLNNDSGESPRLTAEYTISGTPQYMAPEQATGERDIDGRADLYALGGILYFMLTGRPPFDGKNPTELLIAHARDQVVPPTKVRPEIPADLEAIVLNCLAKSPSQRYASPQELAAALAECACADDWNEEKASQWWIAQAGTQSETAPAGAAVSQG